MNIKIGFVVAIVLKNSYVKFHETAGKKTPWRSVAGLQHLKRILSWLFSRDFIALLFCENCVLRGKV